jgi:hypothetical protein
VTWFGDADGDGFMDDADVAFNTRVSPWATDCSTDTSFQTVAIHEFGHVAGLGHSTVNGAIMAAYYDGAKCGLHSDDVAGLVALYPADGGGGGDPPPADGLSVTVTGSSASSGSTWSATATVVVMEDGQPKANVDVSGTWNNGASGSAGCKTDSNGQCSMVKTGIPKRTSSVTINVTSPAAASVVISKP